MSREVINVGQRFGRWLVIEKFEIAKYEKTKVYCRCDCGVERKVFETNLKRGMSVSCGCFSREKTKNIMSSHGKSGTKLYGVWLSMRNRCNDEKNKNFKHYGGRGINVFDEWNKDFISFMNWCKKEGYQEGLDIDRIDVNGNYEPSNCRFLTRKENCNNKRGNIRITVNGITKTMSEWSDETGIKYATIKNRLNSGWKAEDLLIPSKGMGANHNSYKRSL